MDTLDLEDLLKVEVKSASKTSVSILEAPSTISVVQKQDIRDYGYQTINDILYKQPGFAPSQDFQIRSVSSRGLWDGYNNNHLLMMLDGVPINDSIIGSAYTMEITPLFFLNNMEIIRGPGSALYGSNATNGVLSLNTLSSDQYENRTQFNLRAGNRETSAYDIWTGAKMGEHWSTMLGYSGYTTEGNKHMDYDGSGRTSGGGLAKFEVRDNRSNHFLYAKVEGKKDFEGLTISFIDQGWNYVTGHGWLFNIPDQAETEYEARKVLSATYKPKSDGALSMEYALRYQNRQIEWLTRYLPDGLNYLGLAGPNPGDNFANGIWEYVKFHTDDLFARAQATLSMAEKSSLLAGVESTVFYYGGDDQHWANVQLSGTSPSYGPNAGGAITEAGPWLGYVKNRPITTVGLYTQYASGRLLGDQLSATLGARFDQSSSKYGLEGTPEKSKSFSQFSPRLGLVYLANQDLSFKLMAGRAFRAPSPTELYGAHTYWVTSNPDAIQPEQITTMELGSDWGVNRSTNWRNSFYWTKFENQIGYSVAAANALVNLYTLTSMGFETELTYVVGKWKGFLNYSYAQRLDEKIMDPQNISEEKHKLTWYPTHLANFGITRKEMGWTTSVLAHFQGSVARRASDKKTATNREYRPDDLAGWMTVDVNAYRNITRDVELGLSINNLLDTKDNKLIKNFDYPFDYQGDRRTYLLTLRSNY